MLFFPRSDDTTDLKILIKYGVFDYDGRCEKLYTGSVLEKGSLAGYGYSYDWNVNIDRFEFNRDYIYHNGEEISLADLLIGKIIKKSVFNSEIMDILRKRELDVRSIHAGYTEADFYEGESFGSTDYDIIGFLVLRKGEEFETPDRSKL